MVTAVTVTIVSSCGVVCVIARATSWVDYIVAQTWWLTVGQQAQMFHSTLQVDGNR